MKRFSHINKIVAAFFCILLFSQGCDIFNLKDRSSPNSVELNSVIDNPSISQINTLAAGILSGMRPNINQYLIDVGEIGREIYRFQAAEPRYLSDLLGAGNAQLDGGSFYITNPWDSFYADIRNANILIQSTKTVPNSDVFGQEDKNAIFGFARTIKAYEYLLLLNLTNENGIIKQKPTDLFTQGKQISKSEGFNLITKLLDEANDNLQNASDTFTFRFPSGFDGFSTPATFRQVNRALRARVAAYQKNWQKALDVLKQSFIAPGGDLKTGAYMTFTTLPNDLTNPVFINPQASAGNTWLVHPSFVADAAKGDNRVLGNKAILRDDGVASKVNLSSKYGTFVYKSQTAPIPIIRNAELILIRAEAKINRNQGNDLAEAMQDLNIIRNAAGLSNYSGPETKSALIEEMLRQRRYELFNEGHRWIDMRRYDRLDELPIDREGDDVFVSFPIPITENLNK